MKFRFAPHSWLFLFAFLCVLIGFPIFLSRQQRAFYARDKKLACIRNLLVIDGAKKQWALELKKSPGDVPTWEDIKDFLGRDRDVPKCPSGGIYTLGPVSNQPTCSIHGYFLH